MTALTCPPMHGDVRDLARLLLVTPVLERAEVAKVMVDSAKTAHLHWKCYNENHPKYGNGSVMSAVRSHCKTLPSEPFFTDREYIDCWIIALQAVRELSKQEDVVGRDTGQEVELVEAAE